MTGAPTGKSDGAPTPAAGDAAERIRLLEFQVAFLRRELTFVTRRYDDLRWSAAWTLAKPVKRAEDFAHALVRRLRTARSSPRPTTTRPASPPRDPATAEQGTATVDAIAARIAAKMTRHR